MHFDQGIAPCGGDSAAIRRSGQWLGIHLRGGSASSWFSRAAGRLARRYGLEAALLICAGGAFLAFLVGLALRRPAANIGPPSTRKVMTL
ncbi:MAG: hypothetical protein ABSF71_34115 [Terriglobia bacterium]